MSAIDSNGRTIWIADAHRDDGKRFVVHADEKLTAFVELEAAMKLDWYRDTNWVLFDPNDLQRFAHQKGGIIKKRRGKVLMTGLNDFDFFIGKWRVHHRRLKERLAHNDDWEQFKGTSTVQKILGGLGNMDDNVIELPSGTYHAATIRTYDPAKQTWTIWWIDSRNSGHLDPPVVGRFEKGVGTFYADDQFKGKAIRIRYLWNASTAPHWEQAFSDDGGKTWETNWEMDFTRMQ